MTVSFPKPPPLMNRAAAAADPIQHHQQQNGTAPVPISTRGVFQQQQPPPPPPLRQAIQLPSPACGSSDSSQHTVSAPAIIPPQSACVNSNSSFAPSGVVNTEQTNNVNPLQVQVLPMQPPSFMGGPPPARPTQPTKGARAPPPFQNPSFHSQPLIASHSQPPPTASYSQQPATAPGYLQQPPGSSYLQQQIPGPSYLQQAPPGPSHIQQPQPPGSSYSQQQLTGPSYSQQPPPPGPSYLQQAPPGPSYLKQAPPGPSYLQQAPPGPSYSQQQPPQGPYYVQQAPPGPSYSQQQPPQGPSYVQQQPPGSSYQQQPPQGPSYLQQAPPGPSYSQQQPPQGPSYVQPLPRIDPLQIPRLPPFPQQADTNLPIYYPCDAAAAAVSSHTNHDSCWHPPPPADSRFAAIDTGNACPELMRATTYAFPMNRATWHATGDLPLGVVCCPLAAHAQSYCARPRTSVFDQQEDWQDPQRIPLLPRVQQRCKHCMAYDNFYFTNGTCNFCQRHNANWQSRDDIRLLGTVDYAVDGPYVTRMSPVQPVQLYAIDLTCPNGMDNYLRVLQQLGTDMAHHAWRQQDDAAWKPRVGVCFVSSLGVIVWTTAGHSVIMADATDDPFCPLPLDEWTFELSTEAGLEAWTSYLDQQLAVEVLAFKNCLKGKNVYGLDALELSCGGVALAFLADALKDSGGRGTLITWRRPNFGVGRISHRQEQKCGNLRADEDCAPTAPLQLQTKFRCTQDEESATFYKILGTQCATNRVSMDVLFHCSPGTNVPYMDLATLGELCRTTCGTLMLINSLSWEDSFREELTRQLQSFIGYDAVFKLRCSEGIQIKTVVSSPGVIVQTDLASSPEIELSSVSPSTSIAIELEHSVGGVPKGSRFVFLQAALLYSAPSGKRRLRVSTLAIPATSSAQSVFKGADFCSVATLLLRQAATKLQQPLIDGQTVAQRTKVCEALYVQCVHMLANYRKSLPSAGEQLLLPDRMQLLPLVCMAVLKSPMLRPGLPTRFRGAMGAVAIRPSSDERSFFLWHASVASPSMVMLLLYPKIFQINDVPRDGTNYGDFQPGDGPEYHGYVRMPPMLSPSMENLHDDGIYLVDGGLKILVVFGKSVPNEIRQQAVAQPLADWNSTASNYLWQLRTFNSTGRGSESELRPTYPEVTMIFQQGDHDAPQELQLLDLLVDDAIGGEKDYGEFLIKMHRAIREYKG